MSQSYSELNNSLTTCLEQYDIYNFLISGLIHIQLLMNELYPFEYITSITINNYQYLDTLIPLNNLNHLEILNLDYCNLDNCDMNLSLENLVSISINNCNLKTLPLCIVNSYWIKEIHAENNNITNISNKIVRLPFLHILNLIGNNINVMYLPPILYSYYKIGLEPEKIDFIKDRKLLIAIEKKDIIIFS